jgi:DNA invertase Pin-like site-specific DNA recombinase
MKSSMKQAVGYVCDIEVAGTDTIITRADQRDRIRKYAEKENIRLVGIFEDETCTPDILIRPGVRKMLNSAPGYEQVLVERVWALSNDTGRIKPFLDVIQKKGARLIATADLWDRASQVVRRYYAMPAHEQGTTMKRTVLAVKNGHHIDKDSHAVQAA